MTTNFKANEGAKLHMVQELPISYSNSSKKLKKIRNRSRIRNFKGSCRYKRSVQNKGPSSKSKLDIPSKKIEFFFYN